MISILIRKIRLIRVPLGNENGNGNGNENENENAAIGAALLCGMAARMTLMTRINADEVMTSFLIRANPQNPPDPRSLGK